MVSLREIDRHSAELPQIRELYEGAFPSDERRDFGDWLHLLEERPEFRVFAIYDGAVAAGFISVWTWESWRYAEHFAIDGSRRGTGIGAAAFRRLLDMDTRPLVLEVERPVDDITRRRIAFYERQGMTLHGGYDYVQPSYGAGKQAMPMYLMTHRLAAEEDIEQAVALIYADVYGI